MVVTKVGQWSNVEDEVLKAAVSLPIARRNNTSD
jgi:hypothetical protein